MLERKVVIAWVCYFQNISLKIFWCFFDLNTLLLVHLPCVRSCTRITASNEKHRHIGTSKKITEKMVAKSLTRKLTLRKSSFVNLKNNDSDRKVERSGTISGGLGSGLKKITDTTGIISPMTPTGSSTSHSGQDIKGLQLFIADLRALQNSKQEQETKVNTEILTIMKQFQSNKSLNGYKKKKYICKLLYVYLTTNCSRSDDIKFAFPYMLQLMKSKEYSEKFIGYFSCQLFLPVFAKIDDKHNDLFPSMLQNVINDLSSDNEEFVILAMNLIASGCSFFHNANDVNECMEKVFQQLRSPTASDLVKQRASLTFAAMLRSNPGYLSSMDLRKINIWVQRIVGLIDNKDILLSTLPLIKEIMRTIGSSYFLDIIPQLTTYLYDIYDPRKLEATEKQNVFNDAENSKINTKNSDPSFKMNNNWVAIKILEILDIMIDENDFTIIDVQTISRLRLAVSNAIQFSGDESVTKTSVQRISQSAILFALVNFTKKLDPSSVSITSSVKTLAHLFKTTKDINLKYMTLDTLYNLATSTTKDERDSNVVMQVLDSEECLWDTGTLTANAIASLSGPKQVAVLNEKTKPHGSSQILMLDSSILSKWVDLIFEITNSGNIKKSVNWLLIMLNHPEVIFSSSSNGLASTTKIDLKQDISFKISILIEKYATDIDWFIDISLHLISKVKVSDDNINSTSKSNDSLWERLVQIVVNNESLHIKVCQTLLQNYMHDPRVSENLIKAGCYVLGEFVPQIVPQLIGSHDLLTLLTDKYFQSQQVSTRALIITAMMKLYKHDLSMGSTLIKFFQLELNSLDLELQTRCVSYLGIIQQTMHGNPKLIAVLFQPVPFFKTMHNPLLERLTTIKRPSVANVSEKSSAQSIQLPGTPPMTPFSKFSRMNSSVSSNLTGNSSILGFQNTAGPNNTINTSNFSFTQTPIAGSMSSIPPMTPAPRKVHHSTLAHDDVAGKDKYHSLSLIPEYKTAMKRMVEHKAGVLYQNTMSKPLRVLFTSKHSELPSSNGNGVANLSSASINSVNSNINASTIRYTITFENCDKDYDISSFYCSVVPCQTSNNPPYIVKQIYLPEHTNLLKGKRLSSTFEVQIRKPFSVWNSPILNIRFKLGGASYSELNIKLGVSLTSTIAHLGNNGAPTMAIPQFVQRWKQIGDVLGSDGEFSLSFPNDENNKKMSIDYLRNLLSKKMGIELIDSNNLSDNSGPGASTVKNLIFGSFIINTKSDGKFGVLIKIVFDVKNQKWTITCRTTSKGAIAKSVVDSLKLCID